MHILLVFFLGILIFSQTSTDAFDRGHFCVNLLFESITLTAII